MATRIRPANLEEDWRGMVGTMARNLDVRYDRARFDWLYRDNPHGEGRAWVMTEGDDGEIVGTAGAFPRRCFAGEDECTAWVLGDFCIDARYRSLGPALRLQQECFSGVESGEASFCYDFPTAGMIAVYKRLHIAADLTMQRLAKPIRVERKVAEWVENGRIAGALSRMGNVLLKLDRLAPRTVPGLEIRPHLDPCGEEFSALARSIGGRHGVCIQRTREYLDWRFVRHPLDRYEILTARRGGSLTAYAVFTQTGQDATVADLFGFPDPPAIEGLLSALIEMLRERGVVTVSAPMVSGHPWMPILTGLGFRVRDEAPVVLHHGPGRRAPGTAQGSLWLMQGDRDI